jgi:hypothetical protein
LATIKNQIHMKNLKLLTLIFIFTSLLNSCKIFTPMTQGDPIIANNYGYQPLDPLPVDIQSCGTEIDPLTRQSDVLNSLSDETIRLVIGEVQANGTVSYGGAKMGYKGSSYEVIIDYMKFQTYPKMFRYLRTMEGEKQKTKIFALNDSISEGINNAKNGIIPLYIGVGLRLKATITVNKGEVDLGNLIAIGAAAQAKKITGTMVVQTLGISGEKISSLIPMPSEISSTTIQNSIMALSTIKSKLYDTDTKIIPRTIGFYNNLGGGESTVNELITNCLTGNAIIELGINCK